MRAFYIEKYGPGGVVGELPDPVAGPDDVVVAIHAASVNPVDFKRRDGKLEFLRKDPFPLVLGGDGAGVVLSVGARAKKLKPGDEVYFRVPKTGQGSFAEKISLPELSVALKPKRLSMSEAAALPLVCLTSMQALFEAAALRPGQKVFIPAGSGGVGSHAIQIAKARGLFVATTASAASLAWVKELGADLVIDYKTTDFTTVLSGMDAVLDTLGGDEQKRAFGILRKGGVLVSIVGPPTADIRAEFELGWLKAGILWAVGFPARCRARRHGVRYAFLFMRPSGEQLEQLAQWVDEGKVRPIVDRVFPLQSTRQALDYVATGRAKGKVIVEIVPGG